MTMKAFGICLFAMFAGCGGDEMPPPAELSCPTGTVKCSEACVNTQTDPGNCGSCGNPCVGARKQCIRGVCGCFAGATGCGGECVDTATDPKNCGACGTVCANVCDNGKCAAGCGALTNCNGACVDTMTNIGYCGGCNTVCAAGQTCAGGQCVCPAGTMLCGGACVNTQTDVLNCGVCSTVCMGKETCNSGACQCLDCPVDSGIAVTADFSMSPDLAKSPDLAPAPTCVDVIKNQDETDVDCGGATCPKCADTKTCVVPTDCQSVNCADSFAGKVCVPSYTSYYKITIAGNATEMWCVERGTGNTVKKPIKVGTVERTNNLAFCFAVDGAMKQTAGVVGMVCTGDAMCRMVCDPVFNNNNGMSGFCVTKPGTCGGNFCPAN